jgi:heme-degrading monooxygenase HmoA
MSVKVLITREFKEDRIKDANQYLMKLRSMATVQAGYVSGQTLISSVNPNRVVVVSTWISEKRWADWQADEKRKEFSKKMEELLKGPEQSEVFLVGEKTAEWVDMA